MQADCCSLKSTVPEIRFANMSAGKGRRGSDPNEEDEIDKLCKGFNLLVIKERATAVDTDCRPDKHQPPDYQSGTMLPLLPGNQTMSHDRCVS